MIRRIALACCAALLFAASPQTTLTDVEDEVMCPVCGVALNIAESPQADDQRVFIRELIAQGLTKDEIKDRLVVEYGQAVLAEPGDDGVAIANWLVPAALLAVVLAAGAVLVPRWRRRGAAAGTTPAADAPELTEDDARRLDEDLARFR